MKFIYLKLTLFTLVILGGCCKEEEGLPLPEAAVPQKVQPAHPNHD